jgi:hypothetical protein
MAVPDLECYSLRRLSPFQGVLQVVKTREARALSVDGHSWHIQVRCEIRRPRWGGNPANVTVYRRFVAIALWSIRDGMTRLPIDPTLDRSRLEERSERLMPVLRAAVEQLPLSRRDSLELWLLDAKERLPIALLGSALEGRTLPKFRRLEWIPSPPGDRSFVAQSLRDSETYPVLPQAANHRTMVANLIHKTAGRPRSAQWFQREEDGAGIGLSAPEQRTEQTPWCGERLPKSAFPQLPLRQQWADATERRLVADFHYWQAPFLLTLAELNDSTREGLERAARDRPMTVSALHRLYPKVLNREAINAALVEAKLRRCVER